MLLRVAGEMDEPVDQLLFRRMLAHLQENSRRVTVQDRHADTLTGDNRFLCRDDDAILKPAEDPQRLPLALLLLTADVRNNIPDHLRPVLKGFSGAGDRLISRDDSLIGLIFLPCSQSRRIGLNRAVRLDGDEASRGSEPFPLEGDHIKMAEIDLRDDHRDIRCPAVRAVVGNNRCFRLCIRLLDLPDLILRHIDCRKDHIDLPCDSLDIRNIHDLHVPDSLRHRRIHLPSSADCLLICFASASCRSREDFDLEIRMI